MRKPQAQKESLFPTNRAVITFKARERWWEGNPGLRD